MENENSFTTIRVKIDDRSRLMKITTHLKKNQRFGRYKTDDVITMLLDSLEGKQQEASFVTAKEALKQ